MFYMVPKGGFGNILFIVLCGLSKQFESGKKCCFVKNYESERKNIAEYKMFHNLFYTNFNVDVLRKKNKYIPEKIFFYVNFFVSDNAIYDGYYQSYKYSAAYLDKIKSALWKNVSDYNNEMTKKYKDIVTYPGTSNKMCSIMVHIRLGDFLKNQNFYPCVTPVQIQRALNNIKKNLSEKYTGKLKILVFSDEIERVMEWEIFIDSEYSIEFVTETDAEKSFLLMTKCDHFIISNSTFSLSAYYFRDNPDALLYAPKKWFGPEGPEHKLDDLYPKKAILF